MNDMDPNEFPQANDIAIAGRMLTRFPLGQGDPDQPLYRANVATWAYPVVGALLGLFGAIVLSILLFIGAPETFAVLFTLVAMVFATGGLHEDGLADFADGLGAATKERALEIMKDSRIGAYGVLALVIALIGRWAGVLELSLDSYLIPLILIGAASRTILPIGMHIMENARGTGLSSDVGQAPLSSVGIALGFTALLCLLLGGLGGILILGWALIGGSFILWRAHAKLDGQTGDVLGAAQLTSELAALAAAIAVFS